MTLALGRSDPVVRDLIGPDEEAKPLEDIAHSVRSENPDAVDEPSSIDRSNLGDVYDTCPRKSCLASPKAHISRHGAEAQVRRDCRNDRGGDSASIETVVLYDEGGPSSRGF